MDDEYETWRLIDPYENVYMVIMDDDMAGDDYAGVLIGRNRILKTLNEMTDDDDALVSARIEYIASFILPTASDIDRP